MGSKSKIEWTDASWNPIRARNRATGKVGWFCTHASEGCRFCYAEVLNRRFGTGLDYKAQNAPAVEIFLDEKMLTAPLRWKRPRKIFVGSMTDLFGDFVPDAFIARIFAVMALCPQHTFQVLTKRPERMREYLSGAPWGHIEERAAEIAKINLRTLAPEAAAKQATDVDRIPLPNVWLGTSCEDQATADERIPHLLATPAAVRYLSCEPLLGPINLKRINLGVRMTQGYGPRRIEWDALTGWEHQFKPDTNAGCDPVKSRVHSSGPGRRISWVICGGESGWPARPMHPAWARGLRDRCAAAGVRFFFKQWGEYQPDPGNTEVFGASGGGQPTVAWPDGTVAYGHASEHRGPGLSLYRVGKTKKATSRTLDGRTWDEFPPERTQ